MTDRSAFQRIILEAVSAKLDAAGGADEAAADIAGALIGIAAAVYRRLPGDRREDFAEVVDHGWGSGEEIARLLKAERRWRA